MLPIHNDAQYRYERKFQADLSRWQVEEIVCLNRGVFSRNFPGRGVNNIYLDTPRLTSYQDNQDGSSHDDRVKVRIRWYGEFDAVAEQPVLELKITHGHVNRKVSYRLAPLSISAGINRAQLHDCLRQSQLPSHVLADVLKLDLAIANRYDRSYFLSADGNYRITVDSKVEYFRLHAHRNLLLSRWCNDLSIILELKYAPQLHDGAADISQQFPFRLSRSSKYAAGIEWMMQR